MRRSRRTLLKQLGGTGLSIAAGFSPTRLAFANTPRDTRLVFAILRGGLDSLHALVPHADPAYYRLRPNIAIAQPGQPNGALDLDGRFGLHPSLSSMYAMYQRKELIAIPAATTSYRRRSHFDAQNQLENGTDKPFGADDGWLNRALRLIDGETGVSQQRLGLALGTTTPLIMYGRTPVQTWAPSNLPTVDDDFLIRLGRSYQPDSMLSGVLDQTISAQLANPGMAREKRSARASLTEMTRNAGRLLSQDVGPRIAVFESNGWDTHSGQNGRLRNRLRELDNGLDTLRESLGAAWNKTVVVVVTEFGRTVAENGSRGTDHGVGSLALLAGGAVNGGRVMGQWPGLEPDSLYEGRDLRPTTDYVGLFKGLLGQQLGISQPQIDTHVFPGSTDVRAVSGLTKPA